MFRKFLYDFRLPGEGQKIDRILEKFAERYYAHNPNSYFVNAGSFSSFLVISLILSYVHTHTHTHTTNELRSIVLKSYVCLVCARRKLTSTNWNLVIDVAYMISFGLVLLNTDLHNPQNKVKLTLAEWKKNLRNLSTFIGLCLQLYKSIHLHSHSDSYSHSNKVQMRERERERERERVHINTKEPNMNSRLWYWWWLLVWNITGEDMKRFDDAYLDVLYERIAKERIRFIDDDERFGIFERNVSGLCLLFTFIFVVRFNWIVTVINFALICNIKSYDSNANNRLFFVHFFFCSGIDNSKNKQTIFAQETQHILKKTQEQIKEKSKTKSQFFKASSITYAKPMFQVSWHPILISFGLILDETEVSQLSREREREHFSNLWKFE
jgi:hypothetical protein